MSLITDAVVFDMDGIIFDSEYATAQCWLEIADKYHIEDIEKTCLQVTGSNHDSVRTQFKERYGQDFPFDEYYAEMSALFHARYDGGHLPLKKGVHELLSYLKDNNIGTAIASSTKRETVVKELTENNLIGYFDTVICGDMVLRSKPAPDIFLTACESLHAIPKETYGIEDSYNGIRSIYKAGMHPIMVPDLLPPTEEIQKLTEVVLPDLLAVKEYLTL